MSISHLPAWDVTAIEIALDLAPPPFPPGIVFSGPGEPRICLVACFALKSQLERIAAAVARTLPARLPSPLRISSAPTRSASNSPPGVSIQPVLPLMRLQSRLIRSIEPGLANEEVRISFGRARDMDEATVHFIRDFIASKSLPSFEPVNGASADVPMRLRIAGATIYQLGRRGAPQSIVRHWLYEQRAGTSVHLAGGP